MDQNPTASSSARAPGSPGTSNGVEQPILGEVSESARALSQNAKEVAQELAGRVKRVAEKQVIGAKDRAANRIAGLSDAVRQAADRLHSEDEQELTGYVDQAADQLGAASGYLQSRTWQEMVQDAQQFARKNPAIVFGGAFLFGLIGARFLKSTGSVREEGGGSGFTKIGQSGKSGQSGKTSGFNSEGSNSNTGSNSGVSSDSSVTASAIYPIRDEDVKPFQPKDTLEDARFPTDLDPNRGNV